MDKKKRKKTIFFTDSESFEREIHIIFYFNKILKSFQQNLKLINNLLYFCSIKINY